MTSQDEAAAREALRQQQQALQSTTPVRASSSNITAPVSSAAPSVTHTTVTDTPNAEYSRELEQRARQILLERAQNPSAVSQPATPAAAPSPASVSVQQPQVVTPAAPVSPAPAMSAPAPTPIATTPPPAAISAAQANADDVHAKALQTLNQIDSGGQTLPKTKMQRLKDLTDLYRADKIGPAEYHQKRAQILAEPQ